MLLVVMVPLVVSLVVSPVVSLVVPLLLPLLLPPLLLPLLLLPFAAVPRVALMFNAASCSALVDRSGGSSAARAKATRR